MAGTEECEIIYTYIIVTIIEWLYDRNSSQDDACARCMILPPGHRTRDGKRRAFQLGTFIRNRYGSYLSLQYNHSEIYIRSTDSTRAKMTSLVAMAAVYRPNGNGWCDDVNWVPVPYTTTPVKYDLLMSINCPTAQEYTKKKSDSYSSKMSQYRVVLDQLSSALNYDFKTKPLKVYEAYDQLLAQIAVGAPVPSEIKEIMPDIKDAADEAFDIFFGNDFLIPLKAGLLLREFLEVSRMAIAGKPTQKLRIYSSHDVTVYAFQCASKGKPRRGIPLFAALYALELRKVVGTGRYVVLPYYVRSPGDLVQYQQIEGCGETLCDIQKFYEITSPYHLDEEEWKRRCNYDKNAPFDTSRYD